LIIDYSLQKTRFISLFSLSEPKVSLNGKVSQFSPIFYLRNGSLSQKETLSEGSYILIIGSSNLITNLLKNKIYSTFLLLFK